MALINCPECGKENVSDSAESCPNCGYNIKRYYDKEKLQEQLRLKRVALEEQKQNIVKNRWFKPVITIIIVIILIVCVYIFKNVQEKKYDEEYEISLAAQVCSVYNYTDAVIKGIEKRSSLEWYLDNTNKSQEEALKTYGIASASVLKEDHGRWNSGSGLEPIEYEGKDNNIRQAYDSYIEMYNEYNLFCDMIANPYTPVNDFMNEVYSKGNNIIDLFAEIDVIFMGNIETDYAVEDLHYGVYYSGKK